MPLLILAVQDEIQMLAEVFAFFIMEMADDFQD